MKELCSTQQEQGHTAGSSVGSELRRHLVSPSAESTRPASSAERQEANPDEEAEPTAQQLKTKRRNQRKKLNRAAAAAAAASFTAAASNASEKPGALLAAA
eukprot:6801708-Alexandrium_andersonii.AAC.1